MSILSSPYLKLPVVEQALKGVTDPALRVQLLSAKVHLLLQRFEAASSKEAATPTTTAPDSSDAAPGALNSDASATARTDAAATSVSMGDDEKARPTPDPSPLLSTRLDLADAYLLLNPPDLRAAESEGMAAESECKRVIKWWKRATRERSKGMDQDEQEGEGQEGEVAAAEGPSWLASLPPLRARALRILAVVEEGLGREGRAERNRRLADEVEAAS